MSVCPLIINGKNHEEEHVTFSFALFFKCGNCQEETQP